MSNWQIDSRQLEVMVKPDGKAVNPWETIVFDVDEKQVKAEVSTSHKPNETTIERALQQAIEKYGVPKTVIIDNGDYRSKYLETMGIETIKVKAFDPRSKPIERVFRERAI